MTCSNTCVHSAWLHAGGQNLDTCLLRFHRKLRCRDEHLLPFSGAKGSSGAWQELTDAQKAQMAAAFGLEMIGAPS